MGVFGVGDSSRMIARCPLHSSEFYNDFDRLADQVPSSFRTALGKAGRVGLGSGFLDTYRTMCLAPEPPFRAVLEEIRAWS